MNETSKSKEAYTPPFRLGKKQQRAILDAKGIEVVVFPHGSEMYAKLTCDLINTGDSVGWLNAAFEIDDKNMAEKIVSHLTEQSTTAQSRITQLETEKGQAEREVRKLIDKYRERLDLIKSFGEDRRYAIEVTAIKGFMNELAALNK